MTVVIGIALIVMAVFLVISILLQSSKDHRLSGTIAGGAETFFGKQKGKTVDALLNKITAVVCALFFICVIAMFIVTDDGKANVVVDNDALVEGEVEAEVEAEAEAEVEVEAEAEAEVEVEAEAEADAE
ncbi:MAG: preprotein translocase subunit SecG [Clostridia bacterium]|nr:preprotein translocase subunit SecG [Clostridia bacterium]